jgi:P27 family predicted phage terminase small subunit
LNTREPKPLAIAPEMPKHLDAIARREWKRLIPILAGMRVLTEADGVALANLCQAYSVLIKAQRMLNKLEASGKSPLLMKSSSGYAYQNPLLITVNTQIGIINRLLVEFGMTPASRSKVVTSQQAAFDRIEAKLCGDLPA